MGLGPLLIGPWDLRACSWREQAVRGSWDGFGSFLAGIFLCVCVCFGVLFVCLVLMGFLCFQLEPCPAVVGVFVFGGAAESKDLCALHPCCEMQACACFASLAEGFVFFFFLKKKSPQFVMFFFRNTHLFAI